MSESVPTCRRWLRFRLRTFLVAVGLLCVFLSIVVVRAERQRQTVARLGELGASVSYDFDPNNPGGGGPMPFAWYINLGLLDYFHTANCVHFDQPLASDDDLAIVQELPQLRAVFLEKSGASDAALVHLRGLERLTMLSLGGDNATDEGIDSLSELTQLEQLYVGVDCTSHVTDAGLAPLAKLARLKQLWIENSSEITDIGMSQLEGLNLSVLSVRGTHVTYAMAYWERKSPKCTVLYTPVKSKQNRFPHPGDS